ncbi:hypothetical protein EVAR_93900_1 [Eumeta japonica]|uniref:Uncharacterized protein n=1 Tax=Eumeta variegata TaxID=151549 RepID=A0A4C2AEJ1_EUMVA|nr:hypothetical protein EVAR_93900_1 [Eumeta japonica]
MQLNCLSTLRGGASSTTSSCDGGRKQTTGAMTVCWTEAWPSGGLRQAGPVDSAYFHEHAALQAIETFPMNTNRGCTAVRIVIAAGMTYVVVNVMVLQHCGYRRPIRNLTTPDNSSVRCRFLKEIGCLMMGGLMGGERPDGGEWVNETLIHPTKPNCGSSYFTSVFCESVIVHTLLANNAIYFNKSQNGTASTNELATGNSVGGPKHIPVVLAEQQTLELFRQLGRYSGPIEMPQVYYRVGDFARVHKIDKVKGKYKNNVISSLQKPRKCLWKDIEL